MLKKKRCWVFIASNFQPHIHHANHTALGGLPIFRSRKHKCQPLPSCSDLHLQDSSRLSVASHVEGQLTVAILPSKHMVRCTRGDSAPQDWEIRDGNILQQRHLMQQTLRECREFGVPHNSCNILQHHKMVVLAMFSQYPYLPYITSHHQVSTAHPHLCPGIAAPLQKQLRYFLTN